MTQENMIKCAYDLGVQLALASTGITKEAAKPSYAGIARYWARHNPQLAAALGGSALGAGIGGIADGGSGALIGAGLGAGAGYGALHAGRALRTKLQGEPDIGGLFTEMPAKEWHELMGKIQG